MASESGVPPSPESAVVRHTASHYSTFRASLLTRYPTAPACTVYRPRPLTPWPKPSKVAGSMPVTGRALLGLSRLAVSNPLQPVSLRYANHASLHQPYTRRAHPRERGYEAPGRHGCPVDARSSNLAHSPFGPDRATTEG